ncbi:MAG TPA: HD domain-containing protein [Gemmata sp.]|nr:HD domain-containing protein [Gemmata sp.]
MTDPDAIVFEAAAFAARAHQHHLRKDNRTPYISHPFRVCLVVRHVFGIADPLVLAASLLHDTIEDTTTDYDDIVELFGPDVARWVAAVSKDSRLEFEEREATYCEALAAADWQAKVIKLADLYDNLGDCRHFSPKGQAKTAAKARRYLAAVCGGLPPEARDAAKLVEVRLAELESRLTA